MKVKSLKIAEEKENKGSEGSSNVWLCREKVLLAFPILSPESPGKFGYFRREIFLASVNKVMYFVALFLPSYVSKLNST